MKILIDPALSVLIKDFSDEQCAELLRCIFEYPNRKSDLGVWQYMKQQIERDEQKYREKCLRLNFNRMERSCMKTALKSQQTSTVKEEKEENKNNNENIIKGSESSNAEIAVENSVEKLSDFKIDETFSFEFVVKHQPKFQNYLALFPASVIETAEKTIKRKRKGQRINMVQILEWIEKQYAFYKNNQEA